MRHIQNYSIFRDGLKLKDVSALKAERKHIENQKDSKPPIIVASLKNTEDKQKVMSNKRKLNDDRNKHKRVFIHNDQTKAERLQTANFKTILKSIQDGETNTLRMKGSRVMREDNNTPDRQSHNSRNRNRSGTSQTRRPEGRRPNDEDRRNKSDERQRQERRNDSASRDSRRRPEKSEDNAGSSKPTNRRKERR